MVGLSAVIIAVEQETPRVLTVRQDRAGASSEPSGAPSESAPPTTATDGPRPAAEALPYGPLDPGRHATLERGLLGWVREQTGLQLDYVEQLYTFGDQYRDPAEARGGPRSVAVAYLALVEAGRLPSVPGAHWRDWYAFFPWEDWRAGRPERIEAHIAPQVERWVRAAEDEEARSARRERVDITFGLGGSSWDGERVLERYELLYEVGLVDEAHSDRALAAAAGVALRHQPWLPALPDDRGLGCPMARDHRRILATALGRLRGKIKYRPVVFDLLPPTFTLGQLQGVVESLAGMRLHRSNFRRLVEHGGLVEGTGRSFGSTGGRPAELFRFRREVLRERRAPGVGLPGAPRASGAP